MVLSRRPSGFTLVELLLAVSISTVGMVFVLGALMQCLAALNTTEKRITASNMINQRLVFGSTVRTRCNETGLLDNGIDGSFNYTDVVDDISSTFGRDTGLLRKGMYEETFTIFWKQNGRLQNMSGTKFVFKPSDKKMRPSRRNKSCPNPNHSKYSKYIAGTFK